MSLTRSDRRPLSALRRAPKGRGTKSPPWVPQFAAANPSSSTGAMNTPRRRQLRPRASSGGARSRTTRSWPPRRWTGCSTAATSLTSGATATECGATWNSPRLSTRPLLVPSPRTKRRTGEQGQAPYRALAVNSVRIVSRILSRHSSLSLNCEPASSRLPAWVVKDHRESYRFRRRLILFRNRSRNSSRTAA